MAQIINLKIIIERNQSRSDAEIRRSINEAKEGIMAQYELNRFLLINSIMPLTPFAMLRLKKRIEINSSKI